LAAPPPPPPPPPPGLFKSAPPPPKSGGSGGNLSSLLASHHLATGDTGSTGYGSGRNPADEAPSQASYSGPIDDSPSSPSGRGGGGKPKKQNELMSELAMAIGVPKNYSKQQQEERNPSLVPSRGYRGPASVKVGGGTQGYDKVCYSLKGPQVAKVQSLVIYELHCKDEAKTDYLDIEEDIFEAELTATAKGETMKGKVEKERKGVLKVSFRGRYVGEYTFNIWVRGALEKRVLFDPPVALKLIAGDPLVQEELNFVLTGWGMHGGTIGKPLVFELNVKNGQGKPRDIDPQRLTAKLSQDLKKTPGYPEKSSSEGKYTLEFSPPGPGKWVIAVEYGGQEVCKASIELNYGIDPHHTEVVDPPTEVLVGKLSTFTIQAKGQDAQIINTGGEKFEVACSGPKGGISGLKVTDELTGKYTVKFTLMVAGQYKFFISLKGTDIKGVPISVVAK